MAAASIQVAKDDTRAQVRVAGRATFTCSNSVKEFGHHALDDGVTVLQVDLSECAGLDSTFMGMLAALGMHARRTGAKAEIVNAGDNLKRLLNELGVDKVYLYTATREGTPVDWVTLCKSKPAGAGSPVTEQDVLDAHETLMELDPRNVPKFQDVVDYLRQEINRKDDNGKGS